MPDKILDFRSDTVTRPAPGMRQAMAEAEVGDDVLGDDPTVNRLQERVAALLGKEAALFVPSGTMANLIAVSLHCRPGDELICEAGCHIYNYEQGGYARFCGAVARTGTGRDGVMQREQVQNLMRPDDVHASRTRLVTIENTHNRGGGKIQPFETVEAICGWARQSGLRTHLDGARLLNAVVATGIEAPRWAAHFDPVSLCCCKGLGAPVGSALAGPKDLIREARRTRKLLGGGMRPAGVLAAAALWALDHHVDRLAEDHANARRLADGIRRISCLRIEADRIDTNMVFFRADPALGSGADLCARLRAQGLLISVMPVAGPPTFRAVTHLDLDRNDVDRAVEILGDLK